MSARTFPEFQQVDFAIVGSGAAGGVIARELAQAGFSAVLFEQGPRLEPNKFEHDEFKYWFLAGITNDPGKNPQTFRSDPARTAERIIDRTPLTYARPVGGRSVHFTANYWRFHEVDFDERSRLGAITGTTFADWPITYAELEPYYTKVEWEVGVSGLAGASPFDPSRSKPYPMPPLPVKSSGVLLERGARKLGLASVPGADGDRVGAVQGPPRLRALRLLHRLRLRNAGQVVDALHDDPGGRGHRALRSAAAELCRASRPTRRARDRRRLFRQGKREHFQKARAVVVCANGAETSRLLLMSANSSFPTGLANSSGLVGKNLMFNYAQSTRCSSTS